MSARLCRTNGWSAISARHVHTNEWRTISARHVVVNVTSRLTRPRGETRVDKGLRGLWRNRSSTGYWRSLQLMRWVMWRAGWMLTNRGQLRWINDWIIQWRSHRYHQWWQLIVPCSTYMVTTSTLWTWHDECNMSFWWCSVPVILFFDGHKNMRANFLARQLHSCLILHTRNKFDYKIFVSI